MAEMSPAEGKQRATRLIAAAHGTVYTGSPTLAEFRHLVQLEMDEVGDDLENLLFTVAALGGTLAETLRLNTGWDLDTVFAVIREQDDEEDGSGPAT